MLLALTIRHGMGVAPLAKEAQPCKGKGQLKNGPSDLVAINFGQP